MHIANRSVQLALTLVLTGCSALIDSSQYVGRGDGGADPNGPSTPEIQLSPDPARTTDDLAVTITSESTDPLGGTVSYETRWFRDGEVLDTTETTIPADQTTKGQTWRVEVTPVAEPGTRRGVPASASVTIENSPPVLVTVGFETYRPHVREVIRALPGRVLDADGDATTVRYRWLADDVEVEGAMGAALPATAYAAGTAVRVFAWASDGDEDGPEVSAGPLTLAPDATFWRQLLPDDGDSDFPRLLWDDANERAIRWVAGGVWEYARERDGLRITELNPTGTPPADDEAALFMPDHGNHRVLVVTRTDRTAVYALSLERGAEAWTRIEAGGAPPELQNVPVVHYDAHNQRVWVFGGFDDDDAVGALDQVFSLDVSSPGSERWTEHTPEGEFPPIFAAAIADDPTVPGRAYLIGGFTTPAPPTIAVRDEIVQLDLGADSITVTPAVARLPRAGWGMTAAADPASGRIVILGGGSAFGLDETPFGLSVFDPATGIVEEVEGADDAMFLGTLRPADRPGHLTGLVPTGDIFAGESFFALYDVTIDAATQLASAERPTQISEAFGTVEADTLRILGGRGASGTRADAWTVDLTTWRWTPLVTSPDPITMASPAPRFGVIAQTSSGAFAGAELFAVGGSLADGVLADMQAWQLMRDARWLQRTLRAGASAPDARTGHAVFPGQCGRNVLTIFGGQTASGVPLPDTATLECETDRSCEWTSSVGGTPPSARAFAPMVQVGDSDAWLFGGETAGGPVNDTFSFDECSSPGQWLAITPDGTPPAARFGHSAAPIDGGAASDSILYFGGLGAGDVALDDTHRLVLVSPTAAQWVPVEVTGPRPPARAFHLAFWDAARTRMLVVGGRTGRTGRSRSDVWELSIRP